MPVISTVVVQKQTYCCKDVSTGYSSESKSFNTICLSIINSLLKNDSNELVHTNEQMLCDQALFNKRDE
jgi:hypothetical protein